MSEYGKVWQHPADPIWVVFYPTTDVRAAHFQAYRAVKPVPAGREPWTVDNRRIGGDRGFASLDEAVTAANETTVATGA